METQTHLNGQMWQNLSTNQKEQWWGEKNDKERIRAQKAAKETHIDSIVSKPAHSLMTSSDYSACPAYRIVYLAPELENVNPYNFARSLLKVSDREICKLALPDPDEEGATIDEEDRLKCARDQDVQV